MTSHSFPWPVARLGDVAETALGKMLDKGKSHGWPMVPYLRNVNVQWGRIDTKDIMAMELADNDRSRFGVLPGDLLVCEGGEVGRAAIWREHGGFMAYQKALHRIRDTGALDMNFLRYLLEHYQANGLLRQFSTGSTIAHLPQQQLRNLPILLPDRPVQRRIVDILEDHLSSLDAAEEDISGATQKLRALTRASWSEEFAALEATSGMSALLDVAEIANGQTPKAFNEVLHTSSVPDSIPFYKVGDMNHSDGRSMAEARSYVTRTDAARFGMHVRRPGTVLIPKRGGAIATNKKRILATEATYDLNTMGLVPGPLLLPNYLWHWFEGIDLGQLSDGSNVPQINAQQISLLFLPVPELPVQVEVVSRRNEFVATTRRLEAASEKCRLRSVALRRSLLLAAFSGRLTGRASDMYQVEEAAGV